MQTSDYLEQLVQDRDDLVSNLTTKGITGLTGDETFTELVPEVLNIPSGGDVSDYIVSSVTTSNYIREYHNPAILSLIKKIPNSTTLNITNYQGLFKRCVNLTEAPNIDTSNATSVSGMFSYCTSLTTVPLLNLSNATDVSGMFRGCSSLTTIPQFNLSSATSLSNFVDVDCKALSNNSLNNLLGSLASATSYTGTKTLYTVFYYNMSAYYPASTIQSLSNYQAFIDAGWTIGWS